jgi:hypothetical protein
MARQPTRYGAADYYHTGYLGWCGDTSDQSVTCLLGKLDFLVAPLGQADSFLAPQCDHLLSRGRNRTASVQGSEYLI